MAEEGVTPTFTAGQAAQKAGFVQAMGAGYFTAGQAAQKRQRRFGDPPINFTAGQAAQKTQADQA